MSLHFARPVHPGEYLREEYLVPLGMSAGALAKKLDIPRSRIERIVREEIGLSTDTALRLARFFRTTLGLLDELSAGLRDRDRGEAGARRDHAHRSGCLIAGRRAGLPNLPSAGLPLAQSDTS